MKHESLGELQFSSISHGWSTTSPFEIDFFRRAGLHLPKDPEGGSGRGGRVDVGFAVEGDEDYEQYDGRQRHQPPKPTRVQLAAWRALSDAGDRVWKDITRSLLAEYQRQHPARLRWWQAAYGHYKVDFVLPEVRDESALLKLVHPESIHVMGHEPGDRHAQVGVAYRATWIDNGIGALIRNGGLAALGPADIAFERLNTGGECEHPAVGRLTRKGSGEPWRGVIPCETLSRFMMVADERAAFRRTGKPFSGDEAACFLSWPAARGEFALWVHAAEGEPLTAQQSDAIACFGRDVEANAVAVIDAVLAHYRRHWKSYRDAWDGDDIELLVPKPPATPDGLVELLELRNVHVFPDAGKSATTLGLEFKCTWDTETFGFGVLWRDGKVIKVGPEEIASP